VESPLVTVIRIATDQSKTTSNPPFARGNICLTQTSRIVLVISCTIFVDRVRAAFLALRPPSSNDQSPSMLMRELHFLGGGHMNVMRITCSQIQNLRTELVWLAEQQKFLSRELHEFIIAHLSNFPEAKLHRVIPIRAYASEINLCGEVSLRDALLKVAGAFGFEICDEYPEVRGSWLKSFIGKSKEALSEPEVAVRLQKIERAIELKSLQESQAIVDKTEAEAVANLINSLSQIPNAITQIGSILIVKTTDQDGRVSLVTRTLTPIELIALEHEPQLMRNPVNIFTVLSKLQNTQRPRRRIKLLG